MLQNAYIMIPVALVCAELSLRTAGATSFTGDEMDIQKMTEKMLKHRVIDPVTGCWIWTRCKNNKGYGWVCEGKKLRLAHRMSYQLFVGEIPPKMEVCHTCDTPACFNPKHLFLGTHTDNMKDMANKGRHKSALHPESIIRGDSHYSRTNPEKLARGEHAGSAKLNTTQVRDIRLLHQSGQSIHSLSRQFKVDRVAIKSVINRTTWKHVI